MIEPGIDTSRARPNSHDISPCTADMHSTALRMVACAGALMISPDGWPVDFQIDPGQTKTEEAITLLEKYGFTAASTAPAASAAIATSPPLGDSDDTTTTGMG